MLAMIMHIPHGQTSLTALKNYSSYIIFHVVLFFSVSQRNVVFLSDVTL